MITCEQCGKKTGSGPIGESWICADCKEGPEKEREEKREEQEPRLP